MNSNDWLDIDILEDYLDGKLDAKAMHRIERLSLEDPFVAEALAGLSLSPKRTQSLSLLQKQLQERVAQKPIEEKRWQITSQRLSIAAAAAVLFLTVSLLFWMRESNSRDQLAAGKPKKVEASIAPIQTKDDPVTLAPNAEMEKVIVEQKSATYAATSKKINKSFPVPSPIAAASIESDAPKIEHISNEVLLRSSTVQKENESVSRDVSSALVGKVAGMQINNHSIRGTVYDEGNLPVPGALVKLKGKLNGVVTDSKGEFSLAIDSGLKNQAIMVSSIGYKSKEIIARNAQNLAVELKPDNATLSEVVVVGYGSAKKSALTGSSSVFNPVGGWEKFEAYLLNNNRLLVDKKFTGSFVVLRFKVGENGEPIDIKVLSKTNVATKDAAAVEEEAVRLLKDGPKWVNTNASSPEILVNIKF